MRLARFLPAIFLLPAGVLAQTSPAPVFSCSSLNSQSNLVRKGGVAEMVGDIYITCTGGTPTIPGTPIPSGQIRVTLNVPISSRTFTNDLSEALLIINDAYPSNPSPASAPKGPLAGNPQNLCPTPATGCAMTATGSAAQDYDGSGQHYNVFQGVLTGFNAITFNGVPLDPSGASTLTLRITNIRADTSQLVSPFALIPVQAFISITGDQEVAINNPQPTIAYATQGMTVIQTKPAPVSGTSFTTFSVTMTEGFASAFKPRIDYQSSSAENVPGFAYNTESGLWDRLAPPAGIPALGLATCGTRLLLQFSGYPSGVKIVGPSQVYLSGQTANGVQVTGALWHVGTDANGNSNHPPTAPTSKQVTITTDANGNGWLTYEVMASNPAVAEWAKIPFTVESQSAGTVKAVFAPLVFATATPIPRFVAE